jgi:hypothetical protein
VIARGTSDIEIPFRVRSMTIEQRNRVWLVGVFTAMEDIENARLGLLMADSPAK